MQRVPNQILAIKPRTRGKNQRQTTIDVIFDFIQLTNTSEFHHFLLFLGWLARETNTHAQNMRDTLKIKITRFAIVGIGRC